MESEIKLKYDQEGRDEGKKGMEREREFLDCSDTNNLLIEKVENLYSCLLMLEVVTVKLT